jgi:hypothetical protein
LTDYVFTKSPVALDSLEKAIALSAIVTAYDHTIFSGPDTLTCVFKAALSSGDETILNAIVAAHDGVPLPTTPQTTSVAVVSEPDPPPFATPTYRTKRSAVAALTSVAANTSEVIDFQMTAERYVSGGEILVENAELGDYVTAEVYDADSVIPSPYRAALCEAWPSVATYIEKSFITVQTPGSVTAGAITVKTVDTYPLNAKITAGLYLRVTYFAVNSGLTRRVAVNYHLTKKL